MTFANVPRPQGYSGTESKTASLIGVSFGLMVFTLLLAATALAGRLPFWLLGVYLVMSVVTLFAYGIDKSAAMNNRQRTPENALHLLALACGWPGALFAQVAFRHKSRKREFQITFWIVVILNMSGLVWLATDAGKEHWRSLV